VDPSIFPSFTPDGNALQSIYEAFRFTESYGVIFQCNVKYCLGPCEPVNIPVNQTHLTSTAVFLLLWWSTTAVQLAQHLFLLPAM